MPVTPSQTDEVAKQIASRFIARKDAKAIQRKNGNYSPVRKDQWDSSSELVPWTMGDLRKHLSGEFSYGHYLVSKENKAKLFAFDLDLDKTGKDEDGNDVAPRDIWNGPESEQKIQYRKQLRALGEGLAWRAKRLLDIPMAVAYSGNKGVHVYGFTGEMDAAEIRQVATEFLSSSVYERVNGENFWKHTHAYQHLTIEVFPKQGFITGEGFGNLMRLPLGKNAKGGESFFLDSLAPIEQMLPMDPMEALLKGTLRG